MLSEKSERAHTAAMAMVKAEVERCHQRQLGLGNFMSPCASPLRAGMPVAPMPPANKTASKHTKVYEVHVHPENVTVVE